MFFWIEKKGQKTRFFMILGSFLEPFWRSKIIVKSSNSISLCVSLSGGFRGPFWDHFCLHFGVISGLLLKWFGRFFGDVCESWFEVGFLVVSIWNVVEAAPQARPKTT